jgi:tRNA pseudouridine55 synthase
VLVVCLGRATKLVRFLQAGRKTYAARMVLGVETTSQDAQGEVVARTSAADVDERRFCEALTRFQGDIEQVPPMVSAVKVGGERLHEIARRGEEVDREARTVTVHDLILDEFDVADRDHPEASFLVTCSAGTYVRTLAHDLGRTLGVGGSLTGLRRVANGPFTVDDAHSWTRSRRRARTAPCRAAPPARGRRRPRRCPPSRSTIPPSPSPSPRASRLTPSVARAPTP